jgi:hypothetical protein
MVVGKKETLLRTILPEQDRCSYVNKTTIQLVLFNHKNRHP